MKFRFLISLLILSTVLYAAGTPALADKPPIQDRQKDPTVKLCLIANAGFHIIAHKESLIIDGILDQALPPYTTSRTEQKQAIFKKQPPYEKLTTILTTHHHKDHLGTENLTKLKAAHPDLVIIGSPQVYQHLSNRTGNIIWDQQLSYNDGRSEIISQPRNVQAGKVATIKQLSAPKDKAKKMKPMTSIGTVRQIPHSAQIKTIPPISTLPSWSQQESLIDRPHLRIESFRISHGSNYHSGIYNIGYLITIDGIRIFHPGDIVIDPDRLKSAGIHQMKVDVLLMPYWIALSDDGLKMIREAWDAKVIIPMHFDGKPSPWMNPYGGMAAMQDRIFKQLPNSIRLTEADQCYSPKSEH